MKNINIAEFRNHMRYYLEYINRGGYLRLLDHRSPVADIIPVVKGIGKDEAQGSSAYLKKAAVQNRVKLPTDTFTEDFFLNGPIKISKGKSSGVLKQLLEDRYLNR